MTCLACTKNPNIEESALCESCVSKLHGNHAFCAEQITCQIDSSPSGAGLIDEWGRIHPLAPLTAVRRQAVRNGIAIAEPSVSRSHAEIRRSAEGWEARDLGSSNGTLVNGRPIDVSLLLHGDIVAFGHVKFIFVNDVPSTQARFKAPTTMPAPPKLYEDEVVEETFSGLRPADLAFITPSGGGGGVLEIDSRSVQLTLIQLELFQVLAKRMMDEGGRDERVRGFVRSSELLATLAWDTPKPEDNHMKQLVRRVRRALSRAGIPDLIESRHGFGYRLSVLPMSRP